MAQRAGLGIADYAAPMAKRAGHIDLQVSIAAVHSDKTKSLQPSPNAPLQL